MSFPRAKTKRFNEEIGCAPGVGHYNPKTLAKTNAASFDRSLRFPERKDSGSSPEKSFQAPRSLTKVPLGVTRSTGCIQESLSARKTNRSSSISSSHESLSSKKRLEFKAVGKVTPDHEKDLQGEIADLKLDIQSKNSYICDLMEIIANLDENVASLEQSNEINNSKIESLEKLIEKLIDVTNMDNQESDSSELKNLKLDLLEVNAQFRNSVKNLKVSKMKVCELERALDAQLVTRSSDFKLLQDKMDMEMKLKEQLEAEFKSLTTQCEDQKSKLELLATYKDSHLSDLAAKILEINHLQLDCQKLQEDNLTLSTDLESKLQELHSIRSELELCHQGCLDLNERLRQMGDEKVQLSEQCKTNMDEIKYLNRQLNEKCAEVKSLERNIEESKTLHSSALKTENAKLNDLQANFHSLTVSHGRLKKELEDKLLQLEACKSSCESKNAEITTLKNNLHLCEREFQSLHSRWLESLSVVQELGATKQTLEEACENMQLNIIHKEQTIQVLSAEMRAKDEVLRTVDSDRIKNEGTVTELKYQVNYLDKVLQKSEVEIHKLTAAINEKDTLIGELERRGEEVESTVIVLQNNLEQKAQEFLSLETKWFQSNSALEGISEELKLKDNRLSCMESSLSRCQASLQESLTEVAELGRKLSTTEEKLAQETTSAELLKLELVTKNEQLEAAMESVREADKKHCALKDELQDLAEEIQTRASSQKELSGKLQAMQKRHRDCDKWKRMYEDLEAKVAPFKEQLDAYALERQGLIEENDQAHKEISDLGQKYAQLMGHQNNKQKIQYLIKLRKDYDELKRENSRLRALQTKVDCLKDSKRTPVKTSAGAHSTKKPLKSCENTPAYF